MRLCFKCADFFQDDVLTFFKSLRFDCRHNNLALYHILKNTYISATPPIITSLNFHFKVS